MRVIVTGSHHGDRSITLEAALADAGFAVTELVIGWGSALDFDADLVARKRDIPITSFPPGMNVYAKAEQMVEYADALVALDGGDGCRTLIRAARKYGLPVSIHEENPA
jgi:hypothetical protein